MNHHRPIKVLVTREVCVEEVLEFTHVHRLLEELHKLGYVHRCTALVNGPEVPCGQQYRDVFWVEPPS